MSPNVTYKNMPKHPNCDKVTNKNRNNRIQNEIYDDKISLSALYPDSDLLIESVEVMPDSVHIYARCSLDYGVCPYCGCKSHKTHSTYIRAVSDLPILGRQTILHLHMRKFFCHNAECSHKTFAEQPGIEIFRYRRRSRRCEVLVSKMALSSSAGVASSNLRLMGIPMSRATILRDTHRMSLPSYPDVDQIGVDDWAFRKGVTYGSVIVNLRTGMIIDLLGDREEETFKEWLDRHLKVQLLSRDRSTDYSAAVASTERFIAEVADHFHLVKNISDVLTRVISENYEDYRELATGERKMNDTNKGTNVMRQAKFDQVKALQAKGMSIREIVRATGVSFVTIKMYMGFDTLPARKSNAQVDFSMHRKYVETEYAKGRPLSHIYKDINKDGKYKSMRIYYRYFSYLSDGHRGPRKENEKNLQAELVKQASHTEPLLPIHMIGNIMDRSMRNKELNKQESRLISKLLTLDWFNTLYNAAAEFKDLLKSSNPDRLTTWIETYENTSIERLRRFVYGVKMDINAVRNCITHRISNGIVEGFVNKIKEVKRIMFGRAGLELLKRKLILEPLLFN